MLTGNDLLKAVQKLKAVQNLPSMTDEQLSPAAQAVLDALIFLPCSDKTATMEGHAAQQAAAALVAAADQVVPEEEACWRTEPEAVSDSVFAAWKQRQETRAELLAIAAELEEIR